MRQTGPRSWAQVRQTESAWLAWPCLGWREDGKNEKRKFSFGICFREVQKCLSFQLSLVVGYY